MQIFPYKTFTIQTQDSASNIIEKLEARIGSPKVFREDLCSDNAPYAGTISISGFKLRRIRYTETYFLPRKPFCLPYIHGRFEFLFDKIIVHIVMRFAREVIFFLVFCFLVCSTLVFLIFLFIQQWNVFGYGLIIESLLFFTMPIVALLIFQDVFKKQANLIYEELNQIIKRSLA
ncbi:MULTISPECIES: hypothetical protein [unclassified Coleofasciculus]|uniref:hypothetical protein n=1 Tax=unclassified Coleofasciculus TaxID=2692782 RepID=UPI00188129E4|nr:MULTISPECIES: hypothetical protein [unclassified Coleofasciculus]MBE9127959.1 hypothetical protein [Coleofasciculus sp. LEGE 07081]MBE9149862.1 hypothetical protein [Coleofasciculus sp. LEGE 07092]